MRPEPLDVKPPDSVIADRLATANDVKPLPVKGYPHIHEDRPAAALSEALDAIIRPDPQRAAEDVRPEGAVVDAKDGLSELDHAGKVN